MSPVPPKWIVTAPQLPPPAAVSASQISTWGVVSSSQSGRLHAGPPAAHRTARSIADSWKQGSVHMDEASRGFMLKFLAQIAISWPPEPFMSPSSFTSQPTISVTSEPW
jgi:hypothetical protein